MNGGDTTTLYRLTNNNFFFGCLWLLTNIGITAGIVASEIIWRGLSAKIAVHTRSGNVILARNILWPAVLKLFVWHG